MTSTETKITFETLPKAVEEIKVELVHLKGTVERLLELSSGTQRDSWMNIEQLRAYHPDHPAKSTIYEWVGQNRIPVHKDGRCRTEKVMKYNPETGRRIKDEKTPSKIIWVHSLLKQKGVLNQDWELTQCLFGEHLLREYPDSKVALESP